MPSSTIARSGTYISREMWDEERPTALVIACSDGRLQESVDEFLAEHLGITRYDRLYAPGGPGALADGGFEFFRSGQFLKEASFLIRAHGIEKVVFLFHGPAQDGPADACCGDYKRKLPRRTPDELRAQQQADATTLLRNNALTGLPAGIQIHVYRCEVRGDGRIQFVCLDTE